MPVPFLDLKAQYLPLQGEIQDAIAAVIDQTAFAGGPFVAKFEAQFAEFCRCRQAIGVGNGTDALWLSLVALGVGPGDEVITVPNTFIATAEAITYCGATPVFVDIDETTHTLDPAKIEAAITEKTRAIIPVHLFGQCADMDQIIPVAREHNLAVIEDACQAHGATYKGRTAGTMGDAGCFSFYPGKNLGAYGEAGAVITDDDNLAGKMRMLRDHGQAKKYYHAMVGWNMRMDGIQGAILSVKLRHLTEWNELRRAHAADYTRLLSTVDEVITPCTAPDNTHIYHIYAIRVKQRDQLMAFLADRGISCNIHYPVPIHLQDAYRSLNMGPGSFPVAEKCASEYLSLPMYPELNSAQINEVAGAIRDFYA